MYVEQTAADLHLLRKPEDPASAHRQADKKRELSLAFGLFCATFFTHAALALFIGANGWDDGSITLAFARTFADSGQIALTPASETVEGFSSPLWFLLMAGTFRVLPLDFDGMILASQLWSGIFAALGAGSFTPCCDRTAASRPGCSAWCSSGTGRSSTRPSTAWR
ncbi:hypothetical protein [Streptomyces sp. cf386]|uniref:hypothetical protein n=1 Tax=Streptomyces sp. cf386 TaxID=1761904 RepID=UPI000A7F0AFD|nr:hypothetical protein [Streptomyces sp. cf386]